MTSKCNAIRISSRSQVFGEAFEESKADYITSPMPGPFLYTVGMRGFLTSGLHETGQPFLESISRIMGVAWSCGQQFNQPFVVLATFLFSYSL